MGDAPKRKMLTPNGGLPSGNWPESALVPYIPEAEALAMVAAAYEAASTLLPHTMVTERAAIRALAPADALAARDALRAEVERLREALRKIADNNSIQADVNPHTMYRRWRKIATDAIDTARAALGDTDT